MTSPPSSVPLPRATYLLLLLEADNARPIQGRTKLEKLAFLVQQKVIDDLKVGVSPDSYHFRPLNFGPFTEEVFDDLTALRTLGLVDFSGDELSTQVFRITAEGQRAVQRLIEEGRVSSLLVEGIRKIKSTYGRMDLDELVGRVYREYPRFAEASQIRGRYF
jgi:uncharacterized protein YwgA